MSGSFGVRIDLRDTMERDRAALADLLVGLDPADWLRPTAAAPWTVRDVVAHVVGDDLNRLSRGRDGWSGDGPAPGEALPAFLHRINDEWVRATARISPGALLDVLSTTTHRVVEFWRKSDMDALGEPVTWAGPEPAPVWLDQARDTTEYWVHQQQIREAVGRPGPQRPDVTHAVLDTFLRAVPFTLSTTPRPDGATLAVHVDGADGGRWGWRCAGARWWPADRALDADTVVAFPDAGTLWRLCVRMIEPGQAAGRVRTTGDRDLADRALHILSIIR